MNFGVIGFGNIARKFVKSIEYTKEGKVYAIASKSLSKEEPYVVCHPDVKVYSDYELLLADKNIQAVYIALPHALHKEWIIKALRHNIAVLSEKPIVLTMEDLVEIQEAVHSSQTYCLEALKTKFNTGMEALKKDIALLGKIQKIEANFCFDVIGTNRVESYLFDEKQGGALNDVGSYVIGFMLAIAGDDINNVEASIEMYQNIEAYFKATCTFKNGMIGVVEGAIDRTKERCAIIYGEKGQIHIPIFNRITNYQIQLDDGRCLEREYPIDGDDMTMEIEACIKDIQDGKTESSCHSLADSMKILEVTEWIRKAAKA